ncbi:MAG: sigma-70 family RNA polymerase sigma factor [Bacteroidetes bacterium]|nr:sigma-70 family RNA polymerase sigma factor [Bacteroidota bacterium]
MKITQVSDKDLLQAYLAGDESSLEQLIIKHKRKIFTSIYLVVNDSFVAEDLFQETFIKVIQTIRGGRYKEEDKFIPWVMRIARNMAIDYYRKSRRNVMVNGEDGEEILSRIEIIENNREDQLILNQTQKTVRQLIALLPEEQRTVLILRQYADLSFKEIAEITHVSINTALGRMRYALNNLRKLILEKELHLQ